MTTAAHTDIAAAPWPDGVEREARYYDVHDPNEVVNTDRGQPYLRPLGVIVHTRKATPEELARFQPLNDWWAEQQCRKRNRARRLWRDRNRNTEPPQ